MMLGDDIKAQGLWRAFRRFRKLDMNKSSPEGYKASEIRMLFFIWRETRHNERGVTVSGLSEAMEVTSPTVTPLIRGMEKKELVFRYNDQEDRRVVRVKLTEKGEEVTRDVMEKFTSRFKGLCEHLGAEKVEQLTELLDQVYHYLEEQHRQDCHKS